MATSKIAQLKALSRRLELEDVKWPLPESLRKDIDAALKGCGFVPNWKEIDMNPKQVVGLALTVASYFEKHPDALAAVEKYNEENPD